MPDCDRSRRAKWDDQDAQQILAGSPGYLFARTAEITKKDCNVRFVAQIGRLFLSQFFFPEEMEFQGKPEL
jgi:hypothetical protein